MIHDLDRMLDDVEKEFDNSISDLERQRSYSKPLPSELYHHQHQQVPVSGMTTAGRLRSSYDMNTPVHSSSMGLRSNSATRERDPSSRMMSSRSDLMQGSSSSHMSMDNNSLSEQNQDRKQELLVKKQRLFEEKLKKLDKDCLRNHQSSIDYKLELDRLGEESKADKKIIQSLRNQMAAIKSKMDIFMSNEELREKVTASLQSTDMTGLRELVQQAVQKELLSGRCIPEAVSNYMKDQSAMMATGLHSVSINHPSNNGHTSNTGTNHLDNRMYLEKEFIRINSEFERLKLRQSTLEGTCNDLRSGASARESRVEEMHRKAIQQHRIELDGFIGSTGKKLFDGLNALRENNVTALRSDLDGFIDKCGYALAQFDMKHNSMQEGSEAMQQEIRKMHQAQEYCQSQLNKALLAVEKLQKESNKADDNSNNFDLHSKQLRMIDERLELLSTNITNLSSAIDTNAIPVDLLAKSIDDINEKFEARTNILKTQLDDLTIHTQVQVNELIDGQKKSKAKVRDLSETMKKIAQIKQSIEAVLGEVDSRAKQDASWTYDFKSGLQKMELKYAALEEQVEPLLENYMNTQSFAVKLDAVEARQHSLEDTMGAMKRDLIEEMMVTNNLTSKQLKETIQIRVDCVREEMEVMHRQQGERMDGRFGKISDVVNDNLSRIDEAIADMQEQSMHHKTAIDRSIESIGSSLVRTTTGMDDLTRRTSTHDDVISTCLSRINELIESNAARRTKDQLVDNAIAEIHSDVSDVATKFNEHKHTIGPVIDEKVKLTNDATLAHLNQCLSDMKEKYDSSMAELQHGIAVSCAVVDDRSKAMVDALDQKAMKTIEDMQHKLSLSIEEVDHRTTATVDDVRTKLYEVVDILASHDVTSHRCMDETSDKLSHKHRVLREDFSRFKEDINGQIAMLNQAMVVVDGKTEGYHSDLMDDVCGLHAEASQLKDLISAGQSSLQTFQQSTQAALSHLQEDITSKTSSLESTLFSLDSFCKSKFTHTERRVTAQEVAIKERVINLEIKVVDQEKLLQRRVAMVEEGLKDTVPLDYKTAREMEMDARLTQIGDLLLTQLGALKERMDELGDRVVANENECLSIAPAVQDKLNRSTVMVKEAMNAGLKGLKQEMQAMIKAKDDELYHLYDELRTLQRELSNHQSSVEQTTLDAIELSNLTRSRLMDLENSIVATDDLLTEQVNNIIQRLEVLSSNYQSHSMEASASNAMEEEVMAKRLADIEHRIASNTAMIKLRSTEIESMTSKSNESMQGLSNSCGALRDQLMAIAMEMVGVDDRLREVEGSSSKQQGVNDELRRSVDATIEKLRSHNEATTLYIDNNIAAVKGSLMDLYHNALASYVSIDDYSAWKDGIERVLTDYSYSIQSNVEKIDSCDAVVNEVQDSYNDHQVYIETLVGALRKDVELYQQQHQIQHQVQHEQQHLLEMAAELQQMKPRLTALEQKLIRQEAVLREKLSDAMADIQAQSRSMVEQTTAQTQRSIDQLRIDIDGLIVTKINDYKSEVDGRWDDFDRSRRVVDNDHSMMMSTQFKQLEEKVDGQCAALEGMVKGALMRLDAQLKRPQSSDGDGADDGDEKARKVDVMIRGASSGKAVHQNSNKIGSDGEDDRGEDEDPLSRFHEMISGINSDIATIEEHLDEYHEDTELLDPHHDGDDDNDDGVPSTDTRGSRAPSRSHPLQQHQRSMDLDTKRLLEEVQNKKRQLRRQLQSSIDHHS